MEKRNKDIFIYLALFIIFFLWFLPALKNELGEYGGDSAQYIILSQSLLEGKGYRMINYPRQLPCTYYPFLFPLLLLPFLFFFGKNFLILHLFMVILACGYLIFLYKFFSSLFSHKGLALVLVGIVGSSLGFFRYTSQLLTEIPFSLAVLLSLYYLERYKKEEKVFGRNLFLLSLFSLSAYFLRYLGIILYLSSAVYLLDTGEKGKLKVKKFIAYSFIFLIPFIVWNLRTYLVQKNLGGMSHLYQFLLIDPMEPGKGKINFFTLINRISNNFNHYFPLLSREFFPYIKNIFLINFFLLLIFLGLLFKIRKKISGFDVFFLGYLYAISLWPWQERVRFLVPVLFLAGYYLYYFLFSLFKKEKILLINILLAALLVFSSLYNYHRIRKIVTMPLHPFIRNFLTLHEWLDKNVNDEEIVVSIKPAITFLYSGNKALVYPLTRNPHIIWQGIKDKASYLLVDEFSYETRRYLPSFLYFYAHKLELLYTKGGSAVFAIKK